MSDHQPPPTRLTLIAALRQGLRWEEFVALYGRLILFWCRRDFGLQESDAEDLRQDILVKVWKRIGSYDPAKGRFRNWLYACTRNTVYNLWRDRRGEVIGADRIGREAPGPGPRPAASADGDLDHALQALEEEGFDLESLQQAVLHVRDRVQPATWKAFLLFEFLDVKARDIAERLSMKPAAVNQAVFRVRQLLRQAAERVPS